MGGGKKVGGEVGSPSRTSATSIEQTKKRPTILVLCDWSVPHRSLIKVPGIYMYSPYVQYGREFETFSQFL